MIKSYENIWGVSRRWLWFGIKSLVPVGLTHLKMGEYKCVDYVNTIWKTEFSINSYRKALLNAML